MSGAKMGGQGEKNGRDDAARATDLLLAHGFAMHHTDEAVRLFEGYDAEQLARGSFQGTGRDFLKRRKGANYLDFVGILIPDGEAPPRILRAEIYDNGQIGMPRMMLLADFVAKIGAQDILEFIDRTAPRSTISHRRVLTEEARP